MFYYDASVFQVIVNCFGSLCFLIYLNVFGYVTKQIFSTE